MNIGKTIGGILSNKVRRTLHSHVYYLVLGVVAKERVIIIVRNSTMDKVSSALDINEYEVR